MEVKNTRNINNENNTEDNLKPENNKVTSQEVERSNTKGKRKQKNLN